MKKLLKNLSKILSFMLVISLSIITFTACSDENKQASVTPPTTGQINDTTENKDKDLVVDNVSDETEKESSKEETISLDIGIYKFSDLTLGYEDIYFEDKEELLTFFETRDLNGVYDIIHKLGFSDFTTNLTSFESDARYERAFALSTDTSDNTSYYITNLFINNFDTFTSTLEDGIDLSAKENILTSSNDIVKIIYNNETNTYSILYSFFYIDSETQEIVYTPLYVKADIYNYIKVDSNDISEDGLFVFVTDSAQFKSTNGLIDTDAAMQKLADMFQNGDVDAIETLSELLILVNKDMTKAFIAYDETLVCPTLIDNNTNTFSIYNSFNVSIINEVYDITTGTLTINIEIDIDASTTFTCSLVALSSII